ncbi:MAG: hypothetical protein FJY85_18880 [Deltaproteobacteria bacterium]|nr:hypothetical protein [Deltaproteobacteria bacterium]MBM3791615.1 hypothetical protein [Acidobacteriota bacterium]
MTMWHALQIMCAAVLLPSAFLSMPGQKAPAAAHPDTTGWKDLFEKDLSNAILVQNRFFEKPRHRQV